MNREQMEMLSVKSAIERTVNGLVASFGTIPDPDADLLYDEICRYLASLFASRQIDQDYKVIRTQRGAITVTFSANKHHSCLTFMVPEKLAPSTKYVSTRPALSAADFTQILELNIKKLHDGETVFTPITQRARQITARKRHQ